MLPQKSRIFLVEDEPSSFDSAYILETFGHEIVVAARNFEQAIDQFPVLRKKRVNVAIIDKNLPGYGQGDILAAMLRKIEPDIKIIGNGYEEDMTGVDVNCQKKLGRIHLAQVVDELS